MIAEQNTRYLQPGRADRVMMSMMNGLARLGIGVAGSRELAVRGRRSGEWRTVPVNLLTLDGERYLVAPRGHVQWVRNLRASGDGTLRVGRKVEPFRAEELADADKPDILRAYLKKWAWEVGAFFGDDVKVDSPTETLLRVAPGFPVFKVLPA